MEVKLDMFINMGRVDMAERGKRDKGGREQKKKAKQTIKEKRREKKEKIKSGTKPSQV
jgi:hypothetical protein